ncbi:hypothetical protein [uncultured Algibacter sp.]|uniref:hypothetical protein n=1 Tax=uncultured Algibacter sp. TaxID=298659 RepID=UPI002607D03C|nr:hypothetical protein [uncultured Algibacter sp.]
MALSICYAFGPSHNEINKLLHILTHQLEMPDTVLVHSNLNDLEHDDVHFFKNEQKGLHNHKVLEILDNILEASNSESDSENSELVNQKIDKHIRVKKRLKKQVLFLSLQIEQTFLFNPRKIQEGFIKKTIEPPQMV